MNLHEYQGKALLKKYGIKIQRGILTEKTSEINKIGLKIKEQTGTKYYIIKAQIHAGGRGKGGGIQLAKDIYELETKSKEILGMNLITPQTGKKGKIVKKIYIAEDVYYPGENDIKEYYLSILLNRSTGKNMIMYSTEGGMDIEEVAEKMPDKIYTELIDPSIGIQDFQIRKIHFNLKLDISLIKEFNFFIKKLYQAYIDNDLNLLEINPLLKTSDNNIIVVDTKISVDNNALYRHNDLKELRDIEEEDKYEVEASNYKLNFIKLEGNVGCMVNGAGLAMATMDIIKLYGGNPANFLDVGGTADSKRIEQAFKIILKDKNVKAILINIFGGIVRCDRVAEGIIQAFKSIDNEIEIPIIVRLEGTNSQIANELIKKSKLKVYSAKSLEQAALLIKELI